jgi:LysM repeat protein
MGRAAAFPGLEAGVPTGAQPDRAADRWPVDPDSAGHLRYTVQPGDTLYDIAERFGARPESLETINDLADAFISPGDILRVPRSGTGPAGAEGPKEIEVDIGEQRLRAWQGGRLVWNFLASTGLSGYPTRRGEFVVQSKVDDAWSSAWQLWMPHWLGIYWAGGSENGIHALPIKADSGTELWAGFLGSPISYGCIVISPEAASALYDWAELETPVVIHD